MSQTGNMEPRRKERRPPPTLRTKTGCINCRSRRKKCDERHPRCAACAKRRLKCSWPCSNTEAGHRKTSHTDVTTRSVANAVHRPASITIHLTRQDAVDPLSPTLALLRSSQLPPVSPGLDQELLNHYASKLCSILLRNNAHPDFQRYFLMSSILPRLQLMVDPLLACASLDLSKRLPTYRGLAMKYYSQAVTAVREKIAQGNVQGTEDWLLLNILHLNLFETWDVTSSNPVLLHIEGAAQILKLRGSTWRDSNAATRSTSDKVFARIAAEAFVYHTVSWSIFNGNPISMPTDELWGFLEPYFAIRPFPKASESENTPVLGVPWQLYRFLSDLTQLSHQLPLNSSDYDTAVTLTKEIGIWESEDSLNKANETGTETSLHTLRYNQRTNLFIIALKILLFKFLHPETSASSHTIQSYVIEAIRLIQPHVLERFHFWPLLIVGSAVLHLDQAEIIRHTLIDISKTTNSGTFLKTTRVLETIWASTLPGSETARSITNLDLWNFQEDGLDLLLGRGSILGLINC